MKNEIIMEMEYFNKEINNIIQRITNLNNVKKDNDLVINICYYTFAHLKRRVLYMLYK